MDRQEHQAEQARPAPAPTAALPARDAQGVAHAGAAIGRRAIAAGAPPPGSGRRAGTGIATLLYLQRSAGNRAVVWFLQRQARHPAIGGRRRPGVAATEAVALEDDDIGWIEEQLEAEAGEEGAEGGETGDQEGGGEEGAASEGAEGPAAAAQQEEDAAALSCIVFEGGVALSAVLAAGDGSAVSVRPLADLAPEVAEGIARAGVVTTEFSDAAFRSLQALGFIDIGSGKVFPPAADLEISGIPPRGSGFSKQYRLLPTTTRDHSFKVVAAPAGTYDTGLTVPVQVGGETLELRKLVEVTEDVAARTRRYEQEHVDDTVEAFNMTFQEAADAVNHFAGGDGQEPIHFRGNSEEEIRAYVEGRLTDFHGRKKLGGKPADWVSAYKRLLALTISERDAKGTHSWSLARKPKVDRAAGTVTYQLNPPTATAGPAFTEITWDKV